MELIEKNTFSGQVYSYPVENLEKLLVSDLRFTESGTTSLMKTLKIPKVYFEKQLMPVKRDLLIRQKADFKGNDELIFLMRDNEVVYTAKRNDNIGVEDPDTKFNINTQNNWVYRYEDLNKGVRRYVNSTALLSDRTKSGDFVPALYLDVPILYAGKMSFETGLFKLVCTNGMLDSAISKSFSLKTDELTDVIVEPVIKGIMEALLQDSNKYVPFLEFLNDTSTNAESAIQLLESWKVNKMPGKLIQNVSTWINYVVVGKEDLDPILPKQCHTYSDLNDAITRHAQSLENYPAQKKVESLVFELFYEEYKATQDKKIQGFYLKDLVKNLGAVPSLN